MKSIDKIKILSFIVVVGVIFMFPLLQASSDKKDFINADIKTSDTLMTYASEGYTIWEGSNYSFCEDMIADNLGNVYISGIDWSSYISKIIVIKYNNVLNEIWNITLATGYYTAICVDSLGNPIVSVNSFLFKLNSDNGSITWTKTFNVNFTSIALDASNNIYLSALNRSGLAGSLDYFVMKCTPDGTQLWNATWGSTGYDYCREIQVDSNNNTYVVGSVQYLGAGGKDACLVKFNATGIFEWYATFGGPDDDYGISIAFDSNDNPHIAGSIEFDDDRDIFIAKYDENGNRKWHQIVGWWNSYDSCSKIFINKTTNHMLLCCENYYGNWDRNFGFLYMDAGYNYYHYIYYFCRSESEHHTYTGAYDSQGNIYIAGAIYGPETSYDYKIGFVRFGKDYDQDGLSNYQELNIYGTDIYDPDSDNDGYSDGWEVFYGYDPLDPNSSPENDVTIPSGHVFLIITSMAIGITIVIRKIYGKKRLNINI
ncbi:MAG: hypothetical protein ACFFAS_14160 [Promethearchaeota archaeon]